jgi:hypothetical protein
LQISQGYIIRILQHFATKLWNITNFVMLFQAAMKFLSWSIMQMVHCGIHIRSFITFKAFLQSLKNRVDGAIRPSYNRPSVITGGNWVNTHLIHLSPQEHLVPPDIL